MIIKRIPFVKKKLLNEIYKIKIEVNKTTINRLKDESIEMFEESKCSYQLVESFDRPVESFDRLIKTFDRLPKIFDQLIEIVKQSIEMFDRSQ